MMLGGCSAVQLSDDFAGTAVGDQWRVVGGQWSVQDGAARSGISGEGWMVWKGLVAPRKLSSEVEITPEKSGVPGAWGACGLAAFLDGGNYWRVAMVEGATDKNRHYFELVEKLNGVWQAQNEEATRLAVVDEKQPGARWDYGHKYRVRIEIDGAQVAGSVYEGDALVWRKAFAMPASVAAVRGGWPTFNSVSMVAAFRAFRAEAEMAQPGGRAAQRRVLGVDNDLPGADAAVAAWVKTALTRAGIAAVSMPATEFAAKGVSADEWDVVVLPSAQVVPLGTGLAIDKYLRGGGQLDVLAEGVPFERQLVSTPGGWVTAAEAQAQAPATKAVVEANQGTLTKLVYGSNRAEQPAVTVEDGPAQTGGTVFHARVPAYDGWATWIASVAPGSLDARNPMLMFWAKGDAATTHLVIEVQDTDGGRWIGGLPISAQWKRYAVGPNDLPWWGDSPGPKHGEGDHVDPARIVRIGFGLAKSHTPLADGPKEFWMSSIGAGPMAEIARPEARFVPDLEGITPWYKTYPFPGVAEIATADDTAWPPATAYWSGEIRCGYARPWGKVMTGVREKRWVPILEARDGKSGRMYPASLIVQVSGAYAGATWAYWGVPAAALPQGGDRLGDLFAAVVRAQMRRVWLVEAGPDQAAYMPEQKPKVAARIMNASGDEAKVEVHATVTRHGNVVSDVPASALTVQAMNEGRWLADWKPQETGAYQVTVELLQGGNVVDRIVSPARMMTGEADKAEDFVGVEGGQFKLHGKTWHPHGVNYWPRYGMAMYGGDFWSGWLRRQHYDGDLVEEDLQIAEGLGMTSISILPLGMGPGDVPCGWDFLERCKAHGIHVNMFMPADPRGFDANVERYLLEQGGLAKFATIWAYDVTWEPKWGSYNERKGFDGKWREWIADQYGSMAAAEKMWGCAAPQNDKGEATGPTDEQLNKDGEWRVMVAAYRRFVDDFLNAGYGRVYRFLRSMDARHLISNRAGYGGTGNMSVVGVYQFDPLSGAAYHDFISPEGYGMEAKEGDYKRWGFVDAYCRWAGNGRPVFWSEFGDSIFPGYRPADYERTRAVWENVMRLVVFAGANGEAGWWWPGGYRVDEKSDYGCVEPYGAPRLSALELKKHAAEICGRDEDRRPMKWMTIDRDTDVRGLAGLWEKDLDRYLALADGDTQVRLRTVGDTKTSADVPVTGVGGVRYAGVGPVKYLNAAVHAVEVRAGGKATRPLDDMLWGEIVVEAPAGQAATVRLEMMNTGEAAWASKATAGRDGGVRLIDAETGKVVAEMKGDAARYGIGAMEFGIGNAPAAGEVKALGLQLEAAGRCRFGQKVRLVVKGL
jgi:hypothetical protein